MGKNLEKARMILENEDCTCVICREDAIFRSRERGVKPLLSWLDAGIQAAGASAADRVVGKGAAFLYVLFGVAEVYAGVLSESARQVLEANAIRVQYGECVPRIFNRTRTGYCPIESAVAGEEDPEKALLLIRQRLREMTEKPL